MPQMRQCRGCGAEVPANAPFGHCPNCLLELGFGPLPEDQEFVPPALSSSHSFGDYELLDQIGHGGMGVVYKARQRTLNRLVAIKMVRTGEFASPTLIQRFHLEAEAAANLHHPNIVAIYETGEHQGQHFFSMALVEGADLAQHLTRADLCWGPGPGNEKPSPRARQEQIAHITAKVARAVEYAHQHGVLHRDIKPSNVLLDQQGEPHLTDFGVAKLIGHTGSGLTASGVVMGTPSYMAPEQAAGQSKRVTTAADIYSLGAILYEMLTGRPPFRAETPVQTLKQVVHQQPRSPTAFNQSVDPDLATISMKCLEKEPLRRYPAAGALADDLERWLHHEPILARPVGPVGRAWRWCRREPALAILGSAILLSLVAAMAAAMAAYRNAEAAATSEKQRRQEAENSARILRDVARKQTEETQRQTDLARRQTQKLFLRLDHFYQNPEDQVVLQSDELALLSARAWDSNGLSITFGVYTHTEPSRMYTRFAPLLARLESAIPELPLRIDLVIYKGYSNLVDAVVDGKVSFARLGPASYVVARQRNSTLHPLAKELHDGQPIIDGIIFTRADSGLRTLEDLIGKSFAFADRESTFGNYYSKVVLLDAGIRGKDLGPWAHLRNHQEVAEAVLQGTYAAGAANSNEVWRVFGGAGFKILRPMSSVSYPWVATTNLTPRTASLLANQLQRLQSSPALLSIDPDLTGFAKLQDADYQDFEQQMIRAKAFSEQ